MTSSPSKSRLMSAPVDSAPFGKRPAGDAQTREKLLEAAINLFERHGLDAVSTRQIIAQAGQSNQSVIQYYFGGREGLIEACLDRVVLAVDSFFASVEAGVGGSSPEPGKAVDLRSLIQAYLYPLLQWHFSSQQARRYIRFVSRMTQSDRAYYDLLIHKTAKYQSPFLARLTQALPGTPVDEVALKAFYAVGSVLHSLSLTRVTMTGAGPMQGVPGEHLADVYVDFLAGAMQGYTRSTPRLDHSPTG